MESMAHLLQPLMALVVWSMLIWLWMYATRLPAIAAINMKLDPYAPSGEQMSQLPAKVRWKADNYNHLMEQPTIFYATILTLAMMGVTSSLLVSLSWAYVALRVIHSLVQTLLNNIEVRFLVFVLSNIPLGMLIYFATTSVFYR